MVDARLWLWWETHYVGLIDPIWLIYAGIFFGPFVQEDAAVITAATLSATDHKHFPIVFFIILFGLFCSDIWKYWIGYFAHQHPRFKRWAEKDKVISLQEKVKANSIKTLLVARFVPLARVPAYIACGYFKLHYGKFCAIIFGTAFLYCVVIFALCHRLGLMFGDRMEYVILAMGALVLVVVLLSWLGKRYVFDRVKRKKTDQAGDTAL